MKKKTNFKVPEKIRNEWEKLTKKEKLLIIILITLLPLTMYIKFYYIPEKKIINKKEKEVRKLKEKLRNLKQKKKEIKLIKREIKKTERIIKETEEYLPKETEIPKLLEEISEEKKKFNINIEEISIGKETQKKFYTEIPIKIGIEGDFSNIMLFLDNIRKKKRILNPHTIEIRKTNKLELAKCIIKTYKKNKKQEKRKK